MIAYEAAKCGDLCKLTQTFTTASPTTPDIMIAAVLSRSVSCVAFLHERGVPMRESIIRIPVGKCDVDMLKYLHEHDVPWDQFTLYSTISAGSVECFRYANLHGARGPDDDYLLRLAHCVYQFAIDDAAPSKDVQDYWENFVCVLDSGYPIAAKSAWPWTPEDEGYDDDEVPELDGYESEYVDSIVRASRYLHGIRVIQRAWRSRVV